MLNKKDYENEALLYAEKYGIIEYKVQDNFMIYDEVFPNEGTFRHTLDLDLKDIHGYYEEKTEKIKKAYWEEE